MDNEQRLKELERRRRRARQLLAAGVAPTEVARRVGVSRQAVSVCEQRRQAGGLEALRRPKHFGRPRHLSEEQHAELVRLLKAGAPAAGFPTELWTLPRIGQLIEPRFVLQLSQTSVWRLLGRLGWSVQRSTGQARQRDKRAIRTPQVLEFLKALQATIGRKPLIIWDRLQAHRSKLVRQHVEVQGGAIALECLPAYAPDLNPVECIWGYLKHHSMPNYCAATSSTAPVATCARCNASDHGEGHTALRNLTRR